MDYYLFILLVFPVIFSSLIMTMYGMYLLFSRIITSQTIRHLAIFLLYIIYLYVTLAFSKASLGFYSYTYVLETFIAFFFLPKLGYLAFAVTPALTTSYFLIRDGTLTVHEWQMIFIGWNLFLLSIILKKLPRINPFIKIFITFTVKLSVTMCYPFVFQDVYVMPARALFIYSSSLVMVLMLYFIHTLYEREKAKTQALIDVSQIDGLTQIYNFQRLGADLQKYELDNRQFSLTMLDLDYFKKINDTFGHIIGNQILKELTYQLKTYLTKKLPVGTFEVYRFGGEEFCVLLLDKTPEETFAILDPFRQCFSSQTFNQEIDYPITFSAGIAANTIGTNSGQTMDNADTALYCAKDNGRNNIYIYQENDYRKR